jgi:hypothetical protein
MAVPRPLPQRRKRGPWQQAGVTTLAPWLRKTLITSTRRHAPGSTRGSSLVISLCVDLQARPARASSRRCVLERACLLSAPSPSRWFPAAVSSSARHLLVAQGYHLATCFEHAPGQEPHSYCVTSASYQCPLQMNCLAALALDMSPPDHLLITTTPRSS